MSAISDGVTILPVMLVLGWAEERTAKSVLHDIIGNAAPEATLAPASSRRGSMQLLMPTLEDGLTLMGLLSRAKVFTLDNTDRPSTNMSFVVTDTFSCELDPQTLIRSVVTVPFVEVVP